jgi:hypothetical protein
MNVYLHSVRQAYRAGRGKGCQRMKRGFRTMAGLGAAFAAGVVVGPMVAAWAQEGARAET